MIFEALNEETNFSGEGSEDKAYATLTRVNQLFIDTVRKTGGNNAKRLLVVTGYATDFKKTCAPAYKLPKDTLPHRLFISVHYYTPYQFCGLEEDAPWGKMMPSWGTPEDVKQLEDLFDDMKGFCTKNDIPAFIGEFGVTKKKESASRIRWMSAVMNASISRKMVPVLWDTGGPTSRASRPFRRVTIWRNAAESRRLRSTSSPENSAPRGAAAMRWYRSHFRPIVGFPR